MLANLFTAYKENNIQAFQDYIDRDDVFIIDCDSFMSICMTIKNRLN